jgi:hypothetical protein
MKNTVYHNEVYYWAIRDDVEAFSKSGYPFESFVCMV